MVLKIPPRLIVSIRGIKERKKPNSGKRSMTKLTEFLNVFKTVELKTSAEEPTTAVKYALKI